MVFLSLKQSRLRPLLPPCNRQERNTKSARNRGHPSISSESPSMDLRVRTARRNFSSPPEPATARTRRGGASASLAAEQLDVMTEEEALRQAQPWPWP